MNDDNGGQAFPTMSNTEYIPGMTLRDWFAGQAMATRLVNYSDTWSEFAKSSYEIADAMLKERAKE